MEWKKEKISPAELERSRREYMSAAMDMMKRSDSSARSEASGVTVTQTAEIAQTAEIPAETAPAAEETVEAAPEAEETVGTVPEAEETAEAAPEAEETAEAAPEAEETAETAPAAEEPDEECAQTEEAAEKADSYGVYTAKELLRADRSDDGLKKAAEILEEMTRNTAIMKRLAADTDDDPDTTDFPDFSCGASDTDDCSFRDGYATDSASEKLSETDGWDDE